MKLALSPALLRQSITLTVVLLAIVAGYILWHIDRTAPWTRDGRVRADWVSVAPDVEGLVSEVNVRDNQVVRRGDVLFRIDPKRFRIALSSARAALLARYAAMRESDHDARRYERLLLSGNASAEKAEAFRARALEDRALYQKALSDLSRAQLDLERSVVRSKVNGTVTNMHMKPGDYVRRGQGVFALVDSDSYYVDGYFEETKIPAIRPGDRMEIRLMGVSPPLWGTVETISRAIYDQERQDRPGTVPRVNPTFSWVRLAQRIPVRIRLEPVPPGVLLVAGQTATVIDRTSHPSHGGFP
ncbi:efflux RND transporter periplasmic adaptor subunit [Leptospirillum ferriphilum]|jgi:multidrug resistance efflux pump|uniref:EmrA, multidrug resistance efflux pump n=3 Tax=Leptospirillum TaxID=179 RepID=J9ZC90_LEPFM|nr:HlyD family secretion protein [Leptospirillum ferriphilum]AFS54205.1 EmrA, multidrug resistance efflux pump [Leptospirillum ferriphilum ML-04]EDZ40437.1 MAG: putative secretion protein HlyD [Leptospirillum sp. Group II '5-way CG']KGA93947.1 putative FusE-MFP/HlyD family membrane fusion protein [Leptospirillum ferriphilum]